MQTSLSQTTILHGHDERYHSSSICWSTPWNRKHAGFNQCFLPVVSSSLALFALIVITWNVIWILAPWKPRWARPFVREFASRADDDTSLRPRRSRSLNKYSTTLAILLGLTLILDIVRVVIDWEHELLNPANALCLLVLPYLLLRRPRTVPYDILVLVITLLLARLLLRKYAEPSGVTLSVASSLGPVLMLLVIFAMPMRRQDLPAKDISKPGSTPTSVLRSPEDNLTLWQFMTVSWMNPLISIGSQRQMQDEDVWQLSFEFQHKRLHDNFRRLKGTVITRLIRANSIDLVILVVLGLFETAANYSLPVLLQLLLSAMRAGSDSRRAAVVYAAISLLVRVAVAQSGVFSLWFGRRCYERSRGEMITMLYEKTLGRKVVTKPADLPQSSDQQAVNGANGHHDPKPAKPSFFARIFAQFKHGLSKKTRTIEKEPASMGKILNLMRNDVYEVAQRFWEFQSLVTIPLNVIFAAVLVVNFLGPTSLIAISVVVIAQFINLGLARVLILLEKHRRKATDDKLQIVSQFVEAIRHLRWYGWQNAWLEKILAARQHELNWRIVTGLWNLVIGFVNNIGLETAPAIGFFAYTVTSGGKLTVDIGFPAIQLLYMLTAALRDIPQLITTVLNAWVAVDRIEDFMAEPDKEDSNTPDQAGDIPALRHASFAWSGATEAVLVDINLSFPRGLSVISGEVAAGKTALLQALLGELDMLVGRLVKPSTPIGYCSQTPWLQSMSIRDNILFSAPYEEKRYKSVLKACALEPDLAEFAAGDQSFIGENGIGLSGGQRARVALARAAYSNTTILLLDDPLSALDQNTAEFIVANLFNGPLFDGRTVVLVTHRLDLVVSHAKQVIQIDEKHATVLEHAAAAEGTLHRTTSTVSTDQNDHSQQKSPENDKPAVKFIEDEHRAHGGVKASVYWEYIRAGRLIWWISLVVVLCVYRLITVYQTWFLKEWGEAYEDSTAHSATILDEDFVTTARSGLTDFLPSPEDDVMPWILGMLLIGIARSVLNELVQLNVLIIIYTAGRQMFRDIMHSVAHATFRFYDVTPVGRLMNRMTSDIGVIDGPISLHFHALAWYGFAWLSSLSIIAFIAPVFLVFSALLTTLIVVIFRRYLPASQSLRRLEMVSLTPLMSNFGELLHGLVTVRAFHAQSRFQDRVIRVVDSFQKMDHFYWSLQAWLMYRYDTLAAVSTFLITMLALVSSISPGLTAFMLLAAAKYVRSTHALCRHYGQLQMEFVSVERVVELLHLEQEPAGTVKPPAWWPSFTGDICFDNVTMKYAPHLDPALADVSFTIKAGSKTAILGRTGSGKSTLALAMLATVLPEHGQILVDNVNLADVDKQILRTRVTFLAQDPVLFPGTMRQNLDPLLEHSDEDCEAVLYRVCARQGWSLDTHVEGGGRNLSQGQRQLAGLARAVLRRSAIIILDEATASIDMETSMQIQQVLHEEMKDSTVITIAHRLEAVSNADYCIVLGKGRIVKQGPAADLLLTGTDVDNEQAEE